MLVTKKRFLTFLIIVFLVSTISSAILFRNIGFVENKYVKFSILNLYIRKNILKDFYWYNKIPKDSFLLYQKCYECKYDYLLSIIYTFGDHIEMSGEAFLVFHSNLTDEEVCNLQNKLNHLNYSKYYKILNKSKKYGVDFMAESLKVSCSNQSVSLN